MRAGARNRYVSLSRSPETSPDNDGFFEPLSPENEWVSIQPQPPIGDGRTIQSLVTMRYRDDVTMDTRLVLDDRELFVKGVQNVNDAGIELRLLCEEIVP